MSILSVRMATLSAMLSDVPGFSEPSARFLLALFSGELEKEGGGAHAWSTESPDFELGPAFLTQKLDFSAATIGGI